MLAFYNDIMPKKTIEKLTFRELEIAKLILQSLSNKDIARVLDISVRTVETHRRNIFKKLNCNSAISLMRWAIKNGIELDHAPIYKNN
jgi:DNA-binding NarL/FixJ family response regulator